MKEQIEKLEHGLMVCEATGTELVHIEKADAEKILGLLKKQESVIEALKSDLNETLAVLGEQVEIVRCRDCKFRQSRVSRIIDGKECNLCEMVKGYKPVEWFCADGERR